MAIIKMKENEKDKIVLNKYKIKKENISKLLQFVREKERQKEEVKNE